MEVTDAEISAAQAELARERGTLRGAFLRRGMGRFPEGSGAASTRGRAIVVLLTGTGFKDTAAAEKLVSLPAACAPDLQGASRLLSDVYGIRAQSM